MNETHPIEGLMKSAMNSIKDMVDVNTIIGEPIETSNNMLIIPISKVCFGFAAGGSEFNSETVNEYRKKDKEEEAKYRLPFGGGSGAGVSISPVAFILVMQDTMKVLPIEHTSAIDKLMDYVPDLMQKVSSVLDKNIDIKIKEIKILIINEEEKYLNIEKIFTDLPQNEIEFRKNNNYIYINLIDIGIIMILLVVSIGSPIIVFTSTISLILFIAVVIKFSIGCSPIFSNTPFNHFK